MRRVALKYGVIITLGVAAWVTVAHFLVPNPASPVHSFGAMVFFNILHFVVLYLGISEFRRGTPDGKTFKQLLKMGLWISFVYGITASLFFGIIVTVVGAAWLSMEPDAQQLPVTVLVIQAFASLLIGAMLLGLIYSTLIAFALARLRSRVG